MPNDHKDMLTLQHELEAALSLLQKSSLTMPDSDRFVTNINALTNTDSLLHRCAGVVSEKESAGKPIIRVVRHLACSGGSLVSKCLSAMPNLFLLSEVHPFSSLHMTGLKNKFLPQDIISQARYANFPDIEELSKKVFAESICSAYDHLTDRGGCLVVRAHSHSDYCSGKVTLNGCSVTNVLKEHFSIKAVSTMRDPVDSYLSLVENKWVHFSPESFDEYCKRVLRFVRDQDVLFHYEDFVSEPQQQMKKMADILEIPFDDSFQFTFDAFKVSGDSGRSGGIIAPRKRIQLEDDYREQIESSTHYREICKLCY